jgi:hypothetical protein
MQLYHVFDLLGILCWCGVELMTGTFRKVYKLPFSRVRPAFVGWPWYAKLLLQVSFVFLVIGWILQLSS